MFFLFHVSTGFAETHTGLNMINCHQKDVKKLTAFLLVYAIKEHLLKWFYVFNFAKLNLVISSFALFSFFYQTLADTFLAIVNATLSTNEPRAFSDSFANRA